MIENIVTITTTLVLCWVFIAFGLLYRNEKVYRFKMDLLYKVSDRAREDIEEGRDCGWRYWELGKVSYNEMLFQFWKPLKVESFFKDTSFLN